MPLNTHYSLFAIRYSLFAIRYSLFASSYDTPNFISFSASKFWMPPPTRFVV